MVFLWSPFQTVASRLKKVRLSLLSGSVSLLSRHIKGGLVKNRGLCIAMISQVPMPSSLLINAYKQFKIFLGH